MKTETFFLEIGYPEFKTIFMSTNVKLKNSLDVTFTLIRRFEDGPHDFSVSYSPLGTNLGFELGWIGLGLGLGGLGPGLDNNFFYYWVAIYS